jgi:pimeloyl-ACP methyl ester carboxylesterase
MFDKFWHKTLRRPYRLHVVEHGNGPTPVILLHGVGASGKTWTPLLNFLDPAQYRVIVLDLFGFGASPKPQWADYTVEEHTRQAYAALKRHGARRGVILLGHSMGCIVASHLAAEHPRLARRLVLYEPPLLADIEEFPRHTRRSARYRAFFEYIATHPQLAYVESHMLWRVAKKLWGMHITEEGWTPFQRSLRNTILQQRLYQELQASALPIDIVYGRLDFVVIRQGIARMFARHKNITLHKVTDNHGLRPRSARYLAKLIGLASVNQAA